MGLLARQTINCERISVGVGSRRIRRRRARGILPRLFFIRARSRARRFAPVFNITPRSRMFYPPPPTITSPFPLVLPRFAPFPPPRARARARARSSALSPYESRGIAPRNEFTILIWRAALAIYYLHGVGEKKTPGMRRRRRAVEGGQTTAGGWKLAGGVRRGGPGSPRGRRDNSRGSKIYRIYMRAPR